MHHAYKEMLNHYKHIVVGCFKEVFQGVDTNNLPAILQPLKELNFILDNRAPKLSAYYGFSLEPHQISDEEVPVNCQFTWKVKRQVQVSNFL